jgi:predicted enzyme related to lactoylglutathione lyase
MLVPMAQTHHAIDYVELNVTDLDAAQSFYGTAFGWRFTSYGPGYAGIRDVDSEDEVGGLNLNPDVGPGGVLVLLYSADLDGTVTAVRNAGGTIVDEPYAFPGGRRFTFLDPSGNRLGVWAES